MGSPNNCLFVVRMEQPIRTAVINLQKSDGWCLNLQWLQDTNFARVNVALEMSIASALDLKNCFSPPKAA